MELVIPDIAVPVIRVVDVGRGTVICYIAVAEIPSRIVRRGEVFFRVIDDVKKLRACKGEVFFKHA